VLVNQRRRDGDGEWVEVEPTRHVVRAFKTLADNIVEPLAKGDRVFVHWTVTTEAWTDKQSGEKRTAQRVLAEIVGPSLRRATARITKTTRTSASTRTRRTSASRRPDPVEEGVRQGLPSGALPASECSVGVWPPTA
jgi:single-strand DNA-binding protein